MPGVKTPYRDGNHVARHKIYPHKPKKPEAIPVASRTRYKFVCRRCKVTREAVAVSKYDIGSRRICVRCLAEKNGHTMTAIVRSLHADQRNRRLKVVKCLRCSWSAPVSTRYPKGGWVCGANPAHPVAVE